MPVAKPKAASLHHEETGEGPPCLVVHGGLGLDSTYFRPALDALGDTIRLVYVDLRGHGRSPKAAPDWSFDDLVDDLDELREQLGLEKVSLLGHSYGGAIAAAYAVTYWDAVDHLILVDAYAGPAAGAEAERAFEAGLARAPPTARAAFASPLPTTDSGYAAWLRAAAPAYVAREFAGRDEMFAKARPDAAHWLRSVEEIGGMDLSEALSEIDAPTLVVAGGEDFMCGPAHADVFARGIKGARKVVLDGVGHFPWAEAPEAFGAAVRSFLADTA